MPWFNGTGLAYQFYYGLGLFVILAIIIAIVNSIKPVFSRQEVVVLATMIMAASVVCGWYAYDSPFNNILGIAPGASSWGQGWINSGWGTGNTFWSYVPSIFGPQDPAWWRAGILQRPLGSGVVDWGPLTPTIVWFYLFLAGLVGIIGFTALLVRRVFVDVEALQFPTVDMTNGVVEMTQPGSKVAKFFTNKWFLIGFLVQAIWFGALLLQGVLGIGNNGKGLGQVDWISYWVGKIPGTNIYAWPVLQHEWLAGIEAALPWVPLMISLPLWQIGWGALLSTEVLIGVVAGWLIIWVIWPMASTAAGMMPKYSPSGQMQYYAWYQDWRPSNTANCNLVTVALGLVVGVAVAVILRNRATFIPILKFWKEPSKEVDPNRPIPYRIVWVGLIVSVIITLAMASWAQIMLVPYVVFLILLLFMTMGLLRIFAETGGWYGILEGILYHPFPTAIAMSLVMATLFKDWMWPAAGANPSASMVITVGVCTPGLVACGFTALVQRGGITVLSSTSLSTKTRTDMKDLLKSVAIAFGLGILVAILMYYVWIYYIGVNDPTTFGSMMDAKYAAYYYNWDAISMAKGLGTGNWAGTVTAVWGIPSPGYDYATKFIFGLAVALIVVFMRGRFSWARISAAGLALGAIIGREIWSPFLVALIIKYLVIRLGGVKPYNEKLSPLCIGFIAGWAVMFAIGIFLTDYNMWLWHVANPLTG
jgi:hypothetical protein